MERKSISAVAVLATAIFLVLLARFYGLGVRRGGPSSAPPLFIEVRGDVRKPGIYAIDRNNLAMAGVLDAAGGFRDGSGVRTLPPCSLDGLKSGQAVRFIRRDSGTSDVRIEKMEAAARLALGERLDLNETSVDDLCLIPQMKPETAEAIVSRRRDKPWRSIDELTEIRGVGRGAVEKWKDYLEVGI